jgi:hypothetical protein
MKRALIVGFALLAVVGSTEAGRKKEKSGKVESGTFTDAEHGFSISAGDNWNIKTFDAESNFRVSFAQKKFDIPPDYISAPDYTKVPRLVMWVDTSSMGAFPFVDSLLSETYKSKQKSDILKEFELLSERGLLPKGRKPFNLGDAKGVIWEGRAPYKREIQTSASGTATRLVNLAYFGAIVAVKHGNKIVAFHVQSEEAFYGVIFGEVANIMNSLKWSETAPQK